MAKKSIYLTSQSALAANQSTVDQRVMEQTIPEVLRLQLGNKVCALPCENIGCSIWATKLNEDGSISLKLSVYGFVSNGELVNLPEGSKSNFSFGGWISVYPEGVDAPEGARILSAQELEGVLNFKEPLPDGSKRSLWFDLTQVERIHVVPALLSESHYVLDENGNRIPDGTHPDGRAKYLLGDHYVLGFPASRVNAPIIGNGVKTGSAIDDQSISDADARLDALLAKGAARSL